MNIAKIVYDSKIYGPGTRTVIWFQGCSIKCEGCINPGLISFEKRREISTNDLIEIINNTDVTLLGGEPLDQEDILEFMVELKKRNIKIVLFTGYEWDDLNNHQKSVIRESCQFAVLGSFIKNQVNKSLYLRGSENQEIKIFDESIVLDDDINETYEIIILDDSIELRGRVQKDIFDIIESSQVTKKE